MTAERRECSDARCSIRDRCSSDVPMIAAVRRYETFERSDANPGVYQ